MPLIKPTLLALVCVTGMLNAAYAQTTLPDGLAFSVPYYARNNEAAPGRADNDVMQLDIAYTFQPGGLYGSSFGLRTRLGLGALEAVDNPLFNADAHLFWQRDQFRYGFGLGLEHLHSDGPGVQAAVTGEWFLRNWTLSGMAGYQAVESGGFYGGTKNSAPFARADVRWYPWDFFSGSLGVTYEEGDALVNVGVETWFGRSNLSGFLEFVFAPESFRGEPNYNNLQMGVRFQNPFGSLQERDRKYATYGFHRPVHLR